MFDHGISREGDLVDLSVELGLVNKSGAFFSYGDIRLGQGRENAKIFLKEHPEVSRAIEERILEHFGLVKKQKDGNENNIQSADTATQYPASPLPHP
jgi:recombination protein RecA